jgi:pimeloyl-ACP methyl ester carboxylesterase
LGSTSTAPTIWVVNTDQYDTNAELALITLRQGLEASYSAIREVSLDSLSSVVTQEDYLVIVGHGCTEGLQMQNSMMPWSILYERIEVLQLRKTVVLACHSPSDPSSNIYGFSTSVDAEAGAIWAAWHILSVIEPEDVLSLPLDQAASAQNAMLHPLESYVYFIHGYLDSSDSFSDMQYWLRIWDVDLRYDEFMEYSYWQSYWDLYQGMYDTWEEFMSDMHFDFTISDYADDFAQALIDEHQNELGVQIDIVAHSMGGLIAREMLRLWRDSLASYGIEIGRVITLGTPHQGTQMAGSGLGSAVLSLLDLFFGYPSWPSPVFGSMAPGSPFLAALNDNPLSYSDGIEWYTMAGDDISGWQIFVWPVHIDINDLLVANGRAHLAFSTTETIYGWDHRALIEDAYQTSYGFVSDWLVGGNDADDDGLLDVEEVYAYGTNPYDSDTDNDLLTDYQEIATYNTNPLDSDSDNDFLSDYQEVALYYTNPLDSDCDDDSVLDGTEVLTYGTDPFDSDTDDDTLTDYDEIHVHGTIPTAWSTDGDILNDAQEIDWGYDPFDTDDPIDAQELTYSAWQVKGITGCVRANHFAAMDYVKVYARYQNSYGQWTGYYYVGTDYSAAYYGDYYVTWSLLQGFIQMKVKVNAYDSVNHYLGSDYTYVTLPGGGGDPPPTPD